MIFDQCHMKKKVPDCKLAFWSGAAEYLEYSIEGLVAYESNILHRWHCGKQCNGLVKAELQRAKTGNFGYLFVPVIWFKPL